VYGLQCSAISKQSRAVLASVAISLWSANAGTYAANETRGFITLNGVSLTFTAAAIVFLLGAIAVVVVLPNTFNLGLNAATEWIVTVVRWPLLLGGLILALAFIYRYGPSRENAQWHWITVGSAVTSLTWVIFSIALRPARGLHPRPDLQDGGRRCEVRCRRRIGAVAHPAGPVPEHPERRSCPVQGNFD
jgi:uncharacterized BrkB/YihY/UPF0761 family membrane protein